MEEITCRDVSRCLSVTAIFSVVLVCFSIGIFADLLAMQVLRAVKVIAYHLHVNVIWDFYIFKRRFQVY